MLEIAHVTFAIIASVVMGIVLSASIVAVSLNERSKRKICARYGDDVWKIVDLWSERIVKIALLFMVVRIFFGDFIVGIVRGLNS